MGRVKPIDFILDGNNLLTLIQIGIGSNSSVSCDFDKYFFENGKWKSYNPPINHNIFATRLFSDMPPKEVWEKNIYIMIMLDFKI